MENTFKLVMWVIIGVFLVAVGHDLWFQNHPKITSSTTITLPEPNVEVLTRCVVYDGNRSATVSATSTQACLNYQKQIDDQNQLEFLRNKALKKEWCSYQDPSKLSYEDFVGCREINRQ